LMNNSKQRSKEKVAQDVGPTLYSCVEPYHYPRTVIMALRFRRATGTTRIVLFDDDDKLRFFMKIGF